MPGRGHLLVLAYFFPPVGGGGVQRTTKFLKYLGRLGWTSSVITSEPEYWIRDDSLLADIPAGTRVERTRSLTAYTLLSRLRGPGSQTSRGEAAPAAGRRSSGAFRLLKRASDLVLVPDQYVGWNLFALARARQVLREERVDVLYTTSSPDSVHLVGRRLARETGLPWVADFRDPWTDRTSYAPPTRFHDRWQRRLEESVLREASLVLTTTESTRADFLAKYPHLDPARLHTIQNAYDEEDFAAARVEGTRCRAARAPGAPLVFLHTGKLADHRTAGGVFEALAALRRERPAIAEAIRIVQLGPRDSANEQRAAAMGIADLVEFVDSVPYAETIVRQAAADVLLLVESVGKRSEIIIPGKLFEYLGAGRPVLALCSPESEIARLMRDAGAGWTEPPGDAAALAARLASLVDAHRAGTLAAPEASRRERYTRKVAADKLDALLESLVGRRGPGTDISR